ncbi:NUDIX hydrolase [Geobacter argillaceus]|uniref:GDP-mannose pyrophosphatase n=1 Tax=Geobacter argillaceus TaxID=345631 RepID=A0A562V732_9BACT|nr:NUDIX hydrolase [Geobacter argillaceus]TWJ13537.1 ADP-ribose pyrophosphatase [Geobacter argillaceus]
MVTRDRQMLFQGLVVNLEQFDVQVGSKGWHTFQVVRHPGGVGVLPLHADGSVTLIRQLRPAVDATLLEIPAGRLDKGEEPADCGRRELLEETGLSAETLIPLGMLHTSPGVFDEAIHLFLATDLHQGIAQPEAYEEIETVRLPLADALVMARDGRISDGKTIAALFRGAGRES